ncbi:MAG: NfeD family protein [Parvularcula sp.]
MAASRRNIWAGFMLAGMVIWALSAFTQTTAQTGEPRGVILTLDGPVTPPMATYLEREIAAASARGDEVVILEIDTPGGLIDSMKTIIKAILASDTPVVSYVYPQGARSASAGLYIMYGSHVAAMAPYTNTGSATPIEMGGGGNEPVFDPGTPGDADQTADEETAGSDEAADPAAPTDISNGASLRGKIIEDSVAYIRGLAKERGRNAEWAEKAVRPPSASVTAREALELGVIEIVAEDLEDLMDQLDGRTVKVASGEKVISSRNVRLERVEPSLAEKILRFIADPNIAAILFSLGSVGLIAEIWNPGSIYPGVFGALCLIFAFYSFQVLPFNATFLALMGLGILLMVLEAFTPSFGVIGLSGLALFTAGLYFLYPGDFRVDEGVLFGAVSIGGALLATVLFAVVRSRGHGPLIGHEAIKKREGRVDEWDAARGEGYVIVDGERWRARSKDAFKPGDTIRVVEVDGIVLIIKRAQAESTLSRLNPFSSNPS